MIFSIFQSLSRDSAPFYWTIRLDSWTICTPVLFSWVFPSNTQSHLLSIPKVIQEAQSSLLWQLISESIKILQSNSWKETHSRWRMFFQFRSMKAQVAWLVWNLWREYAEPVLITLKQHWLVEREIYWWSLFLLHFACLKSAFLSLPNLQCWWQTISAHSSDPILPQTA